MKTINSRRSEGHMRIEQTGRFAGLLLHFATLLIVLVGSVLVSGCGPIGGTPPPAPPGDGGMPDGGTPPDGPVAVTGAITNIRLGSISVAVEDPGITVTYEVTGTPDLIRGFFVPVADTSPQAGPIAEPVIIAPSLPASGDNTFFVFFPSVAGEGFFKVGIELTVGTDVIEALSVGVINVQTPPSPCFTAPCGLVTATTPATDILDSACDPLQCATVVAVEQIDLDTILVSFDARDPEEDVRWRLFFLTATDSSVDLADRLGTEILTGRGNVGSGIPFSRSVLAPGDYQIGVSATDSGLSVADTVVADGDNGRIVTVLGPTVRVIN